MTGDILDSVLRNIKNAFNERNMSFTSDIKKEIIARGIVEKRAGISAFVKTSGTVGIKEGAPTFFLVSETENVAEFFMAAFAEAFDTRLSVTNASWDRMSGRDKLLLQCAPTKTQEVMSALGLLKKTGGVKEGISSSLLSTEQKCISYIQGAFLGGGSCSVPSEEGKTGYHLEWSFPEKRTAKDFVNLLAEFELIAHLTERKETSVVYIKNKEQISDFLSVVGCRNALKKFSALVEKRDEANQSNRARNCMAGNADKVAIAAVKQVVALRRLKEKGCLEDLSEELQALVKIRLENPAMSLQELADYCKVSKSCLNHRMRRLMVLAEKIEK